MAERLAFGAGALREIPDSTGRDDAGPPAPAGPGAPQAPESVREPRDWAFVGLLTFTALLFFRPQDTVPVLRYIPLADIAAIGALAAMVSGRLARGLPVTRMTPELAGVLALAAVILGTAPFSVWIGGVIATFTGLFAKVVLIFILMVNTLTTPRRIEKFAWLIVVASGYIAGRAVFDYVRGVNLIEYGRVQGSVGGIFKNPNDLALNMVAILPISAMLLLQPRETPVRRALAALCGVLMVGAIVASQSRAGTLGLAVILVVLAYYVVRTKPGLVFAAVLAGVLALPLLPDAYWQRVASITNEELDQTGSREARSILLRESWQAFLENPLTGVGAGQFVVYKPEEREQPWREAHSVVFQVAAELGIPGLIVFTFIVVRGIGAPMQMRRLVRQLAPRRRRGAGPPPLPDAERDQLTMQAAALSASVLGWFVCALFGSVAYHWTFYYVLALATASRDCLIARVQSRRRAGAAAGAGEHPVPVGIPA